MAGEPSPSPPKHPRSLEDSLPDASPKRRKRHHHRRTYRHRSPQLVAANPMEEDKVEEGEILDATVAVTDVNADLQASIAAENFGNGAETDSNTDATELHALSLPTHSSKDERKLVPCAHEYESGGTLSRNAEDAKGYEQSQQISRSPQLRIQKGRKPRYNDQTSSSKDSHSMDHSRISSYPTHLSEAHARGHSRSREKGAEAKNWIASPRDDSDSDIHSQDVNPVRHSIRPRGVERERRSSHVARDGDSNENRERYRDDRRHSNNVSLLDRDKVRSSEATCNRHRERAAVVADLPEGKVQTFEMEAVRGKGVVVVQGIRIMR